MMLITKMLIMLLSTEQRGDYVNPSTMEAGDFQDKGHPGLLEASLGYMRLKKGTQRHTHTRWTHTATLTYIRKRKLIALRK